MRAAFPALILASLFAATTAEAATDDEIRQKIIGSWGKTLTCDDGSLTFGDDGSFISKRADGEVRVAGTFAIVDGQLTGKNGDDAMPVMQVEFEGDTLLLNGGGDGSMRLDRCQTAQ